MFSRDQLKRGAGLTENDFAQLGKGGRPHNWLGFAYQVAFVRLFDRFPQQQPFELFEELVCFSAAQLGLDAGLIELSNSTANGSPLSGIMSCSTANISAPAHK